MKRSGLSGIDAWICRSTVLARALEPHERMHRHPEHPEHPEFDVWIVVDIAAKFWRREILVGTSFLHVVLCLDQCSVGRSWTFHAKLQMRFLLNTVWDLFHRMWSDIRAEVPAAEGQQRRPCSSLGCQVLVHLHNGSWRIYKSWRMTEAFLLPLARQA